jgi:hypothetical protein
MIFHIPVEMWIIAWFGLGSSCYFLSLIPLTSNCFQEGFHEWSIAVRERTSAKMATDITMHDSWYVS